MLRIITVILLLTCLGAAGCGPRDAAASGDLVGLPVPASIDDLIVNLNRAKMVTRVKSSPDWRAQYLEQLTDVAEIRTSIDTGGGELRWGSLLVFQLNSGEASELATFAHGIYSDIGNSSAVIARAENLVIVGDVDDPNWEYTAKIIERLGGTIMVHAIQSAESIKRLAMASQLRSMLHTVRSQINRFNEKTGALPDIGARQWEPMLEQEYLPAAPRNPYSPNAVSTTILVISEPGAKGGSVNPNTAGWVWNTADKKMYAAGSDD